MRTGINIHLKAKDTYQADVGQALGSHMAYPVVRLHQESPSADAPGTEVIIYGDGSQGARDLAAALIAAADMADEVRAAWRRGAFPDEADEADEDQEG